MFVVHRGSGRLGVVYRGTVAGLRAWLRTAAGGPGLEDWLRLLVHN